jgi:hypothetical protein
VRLLEPTCTPPAKQKLGDTALMKGQGVGGTEGEGDGIVFRW